MKNTLKAIAGASACAVLQLLASTAASAQQLQLERVEVTGSSIKRIEGETALPVATITREEILRTGVTTAGELIERFSGASGGNYNSSQGVGDSGKPGFSGVSLRGLGTSSTLILLNGRRLANYAFDGGAVDVNSIPLSAVERVEILRDGASSIYGTDAIGGVINFILSKSFQGIELGAYGTQLERNGAATRKFTATGGWGNLKDNSFNILGSFDYEKQNPLLARQREFAKTAVRPDIGIVQTSGNSYPANFSTQAGDRVNTAAARGCDPANGSLQISAVTGLPAPAQRTCRYDFTSVLDITPPSERKSAVVRSAIGLNESTQLFAEATWVNTVTTYSSSETPVNDFRGNGAFTYPAAGRYYPSTINLPGGSTLSPTGDITAIAWRLKDGGRRTDEADATARRLVVGIKGTLANWDYEAGLSRTESKVSDRYTDGWVRESSLNAAIATGNVNVFGGPQDATGQALINAAKILQVVRESKGSTTTLDGKTSGEIFKLDGGAAALAVGVEFRKEKLDDEPQGVLRSGDILGGGGDLPPVSADRNVSALYSELSLPFAKGWELQLTSRFDHYNDFGNTFNPKIGLRWQPVSVLLLRGSANTGFRAPSLPEVNLPAYTTNTANSYSDPIRCPGGAPIGAFVNEGLECDAQIQARRGGNAALRPEKSRQWSLGGVVEPFKASSLSLDFWGIVRRDSIGYVGETRIFDEFGAQDPLTALGGWVRTERLAAGGCRLDAPGAQTPANVPCPIDYYNQPNQNLGHFKIRGIDLGIDSRTPTAIGVVGVNVDATFITQYRFQFSNGSRYVDNLSRTTSENNAIPRWRHSIALSLSNYGWTGTIIQNFVLGYEDENNPRTATTTRRVGAWESYDAQVAWNGVKGLTLAIGARNVFDRDPPASNNGQNFQIGYDARNASPLGRVYYGRVIYKFL